MAGENRFQGLKNAELVNQAALALDKIKRRGLTAETLGPLAAASSSSDQRHLPPTPDEPGGRDIFLPGIASVHVPRDVLKRREETRRAYDALPDDDPHKILAEKWKAWDEEGERLIMRRAGRGLDF